MVISYAYEVATCRGFGCFPKLLLRWGASIYKLIWLDMVVYMACYYALDFLYDYGLTDEQRIVWAKVVKFCKESSTTIPVMFVLGFYVSVVVGRWWQQYMTLPWPDSTAVFVTALVSGRDDRGRLMRRTIMRYVCLSLTIVLTMVSPRVKRRFPTLEYIRDAGLLLDNEMYILKAMSEKYNEQNYWIPIVWASSIAIRARKENRIRDDAALKTIVDSLNSFRNMLMRLLCYDMISIPLVYTQVVTIAVYTFFVATLVDRVYIEDSDIKVALTDQIFPFVTMLEFLFFMGWLKVAESLISPFGEDDDDMELNWLIDRNLTVSYLIVDEMHNEYPELVKDQYWETKYPLTVGLTIDVPPSAGPRLKDPMGFAGTFGTILKKWAARTHSYQMDNVESRIQSYAPSDSFVSLEEEGEQMNIIDYDTELDAQISSRSTNYVPSDKSDDEFELLRRQRSIQRQSRLTPFSKAERKPSTANAQPETNDDVKGEAAASKVISENDDKTKPQ